MELGTGWTIAELKCGTHTVNSPFRDRRASLDTSLLSVIETCVRVRVLKPTQLLYV